MDRESSVFGLVTFDGASRHVSEIVMMFENERAAERFAQASGMSDYAIGPVRFAVSAVPQQVRWQGGRS